MKSLLLLRHAKSSWDNVNLSDHDRPLNKRGKRDAPRIGRLIDDMDLVPDLIISSSANRAATTAKLVSEEAGYQNEILHTRMLYHADSYSFIEVLNGVPDSANRVLLVGHNPGMEEILEDLTGAREWMPTAALAHIRLPIEEWQTLDLDVEGDLIGLWIPKSLPDM